MRPGCQLALNLGRWGGWNGRHMLPR
jgi:hypothetical protein